MSTQQQKTDANTTLEQIKSTLAVYQAERGWDGQPPRDIAISVALEAAELLEHFQWSDQINVTANHQAISDELSDVLIYLVELAQLLDIDISSAFFDKLERVKKKYPVTIFNRENRDNTDSYRRIKSDHRKGRAT